MTDEADEVVDAASGEAALVIAALPRLLAGLGAREVEWDAQASSWLEASAGGRVAHLPPPPARPDAGAVDRLRAAADRLLARLLAGHDPGALRGLDAPTRAVAERLEEGRCLARLARELPGARANVARAARPRGGAAEALEALAEGRAVDPGGDREAARLLRGLDEADARALAGLGSTAEAVAAARALRRRWSWLGRGAPPPPAPGERLEDDAAGAPPPRRRPEAEGGGGDNRARARPGGTPDGRRATRGDGGAGAAQGPDGPSGGAGGAGQGAGESGSDGPDGETGEAGEAGEPGVEELDGDGDGVGEGLDGDGEDGEGEGEGGGLGAGAGEVELAAPRARSGGGPLAGALPRYPARVTLAPGRPHGRTAGLVAEARAELGGAAARLRRLLLGRGPRWTRDQLAGRLDPGRLGRAVVDDPRLFRRVRRREPVDAAVTVLLDVSGSVSRPLLRASLGLALVVAEACEVTGAAVELLGFSTAGAPPGLSLEHVVLKRFDQRIASRRHAVARALGRDRGANVDGPAVRWAGGRLAARREGTRLLLVLSDGTPNAEDGTPAAALEADLVAAVADAEARGVRVVGLGLGQEVARLYPRHASGDDLAGLVRAGFAQVAAALRT